MINDLSKMVDEKLYKIFLICNFISCTLCVGNVPVLLWTNSNGGADTFSQPLAGRSVSETEFTENYIDRLPNEGNLLFFLQDKLSLGDFTQYANVYNPASNGATFQNLKNIMESYASVVVPSVSSPSNSLRRIMTTFPGKIYELKEPYDISQLKLDGTGRNLITVRLPSVDTSVGSKYKDALGQNDKIIGQVTSNLKRSTNQKLTALYTADQPSFVPQARSNSVYTGRHLLAESTSNITFFNVSGCLFFYAEQISIIFTTNNTKGDSKSSWKVDLPPGTEKNLVDSTCTPNTDGVLSVVYDSAHGLSSQNVTSVAFKLAFNVKGGWWQPGNGSSLSYSVSNSEVKDATISLPFLKAPRGISYKCNKPDPIRQTDQLNVMSAELVFKELQVEMGVRKDKFGAPDDCVGYFTIPIWSGLFVSLILTLILAFGVLLIMNISTMDRFDDPKGKTITVNVSE